MSAAEAENVEAETKTLRAGTGGAMETEFGMARAESEMAKNMQVAQGDGMGSDAVCPAPGVSLTVGSAADAPATGAFASAAIEINDLSFTYPEAASPVLKSVQWKVPQGAFALLVGGTGSGKSTLLSLLKPEIAPTGTRTGDIWIQGRPLEDMPPAESARAIGYVFQNPDNQLVCESVWHEMAFGLENLGTPQDEMRRLIAETSYFFGIDDWFRTQTDTLSGGRKQLLALASTLVMQPSLLLLDEPTAQLDPVAERNFLHALFRVNRELGCTVVVATHRPQPMLDYATRAFELVDGTVHEVADLSSLAGRLRLLEPFEAGEDLCPSAAGEAVARTSGAGLPSSRAAALEHDGVSCSPASMPACEGAPLSLTGASKTEFESRPASETTAGSDPAPLASSLVSAVALNRAWFRYGHDSGWILRNLDLQVRAGSIHALVGGNGCGKSTLLSIVAGSAKLQRGKLSAASKARVLLPQDPRALFAAETALDELMEWAPAAGYDRAAAQEMLERMGLAERADLHPYDLSGGQQQLLALGKLLLAKPEVLLLDEPTKGLDTSARRMVARVLTDLRAQGKTVLVATHDLDFAQQVADTVSMMFDGEIASTEPTAAFFKNNVYYRP